MGEQPEQQHVGDGRFALGRRLGSGAQGDTYEAVDKRDGQLVAIKRFTVRGAESWKQVELAQREAEVLAALSHPALPRYITNFEEDGCLYLVMERVHGKPLRELAKAGQLGSADMREFLAQLSDILAYLHGRTPPVIHRDIKPGNVIRRPDGSFALVDFGAVRDRLKPEGGSTVVGTYGYMAPEQFQGRALPASDVYSVGATALAVMAGAEPETLPHKGLALDVAGSLGSQVDPQLVQVLQQMLEPDPDKRPDRIAPLLQELREPPAKQPGRRERPSAKRPGRRARRKARRERQRERREQWLRDVPHEAHQLLATGIRLGLTVAEVAVVVATQVVVPLVLMLLAVGLSPGLRRAAQQVRDAGSRAVDDIRQARNDALRQLRADNRLHPRTDPPEPARRVRVEDRDPDIIEAEFEEIDSGRDRRGN